MLPLNLRKMTKIKSFLKSCQSFGRMGRSYSSLRSKSIIHDEGISMSVDGTEIRSSSLVHADTRDEAPNGCKVVYVGKSRRRYFISAHYLNHPLLRALVQRCEDDNYEGFAVTCEVVMFEHLVWMLDNADPADIQTELAQFYTCP